MQKLLARDHREMPWKNGGGTTTEIASYPAGSSLDDFAWRVSMARVERAGPFSRFADIDRSIALIEGQGMTLSIVGRGDARLDAQAAPLAFPGDADVGATLVGGPVVDFNVMTRRGRFRHLLTRARAAERREVPMTPLGSLAMLVVVEGAVRVAGEKEPLAPRDAVVLVKGETLDVACDAGAVTLVVDLWRW